MTEPTATTKTDRRKTIRILRELEKRLQYSGDQKINDANAARARKGFRLYDEAYAIRVALGFMGRHVNMETGELTISLDEPAEVA